MIKNHMLEKIKTIFPSKLDANFKNIGWLSLSEFGTRLSRVFTAFILARTLTGSEFGAAAIILTTSQFTRVLTKNGVADAIIQTKEEDLSKVCQTSWSINWIIGCILFIIQVVVSFIVSDFYSDTSIRIPIIILGITYLIYPFAYVQTALVRRKGKFRLYGITGLIQVSVDNILTGFLALCGMGTWSIVLPKLLVAPLWVYVMLNNESWRGDWKINLERWRELLGFSVKVMLTELTTFFRESIDYLILGKVQSLEALGIYYFAFNSGLGLSMSLIRSLTTTIYTDFCNAKRNFLKLKARFLKNSKIISITIIPLVSIQIFLAPIYVPFLYGNKWVENGGVEILMLICLSGITRPYAQMAAMFYRSIGKPQIELYWNIIYTLILTLCLIKFSPYGITATAWTVVGVHISTQPIYYLYTFFYIKANQLNS
ncbi:oligosaccharide flippase family protein [Synechococcus sp. N32]|uniref:oligosaccharide flippase family protein n=1 Tax=Synechococcus sp. N32 TaxID=2575514 RepID=UPI000E0EBE9C|nr:oligosaccharide flippase family protein [Synechococcus sp. N32]